MISITVLPVQCLNAAEWLCYCHYIQQRRTNVCNCSSTTADKRQPNEWPSHIHPLTDWLIVTNSYIPSLCPPTDNFTGLSLLDLSKNKISEVCAEFLEKISKLRNITELNLSQNKFTTIPKGLANLTHLKKIWLGGNPFHCDCSMTWTIEWINKFTDLMGDHIIVDYKNVKCHDGQVAGKPIFTLNPVDMKCFPSMWTTWQKICSWSRKCCSNIYNYAANSGEDKRIQRSKIPHVLLSEARYCTKGRQKRKC